VTISRNSAASRSITTFMRWSLCGLLVVGVNAGCTKDVNRCTQDSDCGDVAYPFCDMDGHYPASGGLAGVCTVTPADCPAERCGCEPGATTCTGDALKICDSSGRSETSVSCNPGCATAGARCLSFVPTNGLNLALMSAANEPDITIPAMATINTDTGVIQDVANLPITVTSLVVPQSGASDVRVFIGRSFKLSSIVFTGTRPAAFVAVGDIVIDGLLDLGGDNPTERPGAGQQTSGACVGQISQPGGGGGGNATPGGKSISANSSAVGQGGAMLSGTTLVGGCTGGGGTSDGFGGGAIQIDSLSRITITASGGISINGSAGSDRIGGGSGGMAILEAPKVEILGGIFANGGSGGACGTAGQSGQLSTRPAIAPSGCGTNGLTHGGDGGSSTAAPTAGAGVGGGGGGGGSVGRLFVTTVGPYSTSSDAVVSASTTTTAMVPQ